MYQTFDEWLETHEAVADWFADNTELQRVHALLFKLVRAQRRLIDSPYGPESTTLIGEIARLEAALMGEKDGVA